MNLTHAAMKMALAFIATLFATSAAFAYPAVNDIAVFTGQIAYQGQTASMSMQISIVGYDRAQDAYLQRNTTEIAGKWDTQEGWVSASDMTTPAMIQGLLANCAQIGGKAQIVTTAAGKFNTCAVPQKDAQQEAIYWFADVPFGIVKADILDLQNGVRTNLTLKSYFKGQ